MKLPCTIKKCLKYPVCKNKQFITCTPLREYCDEVTQTYKLENGQDVWDILYLNFPELLGVQLDQALKISDITNEGVLLINRRKIPMEMIQNMAWKPIDSN